jgi:hypothetical protein
MFLNRLDTIFDPAFQALCFRDSCTGQTRSVRRYLSKCSRNTRSDSADMEGIEQYIKGRLLEIGVRPLLCWFVPPF